MTCVVYDCVLGTTLQTASSGGTLGTKTVTFTVPTNGSTRARIKWAITKTVTASSTDFTISKITVNGLGLEFESTRTPSYTQNNVGDKRYELANHLGNVLNVITDRKISIPIGVSPGQTISAYTANVISYTDYYAFGQVLPNRNGNTPEYRYGFNGMEKDDEIKQSSGTSYDFGARMYDPRIGRWLSTDGFSYKYPSMSPYIYCGNSPIIFKDINGDSLVVYGSDGEWLKMKAVLESEFSGLIEFSRDEYFRVTMKVRESSADMGVGQDILSNMVQYQTTKASYQLLETAINADGIASLGLVEGEGRLGVSGGSFRGTETYGLNGSVQTIDMEDVIVRGDTKTTSSMSIIMHELYEAYTDQVVNCSPEAKTELDRRKIFNPLHAGALELQNQINGNDISENFFLGEGDGMSKYEEVWQVTGVRDAKSPNGYSFTIAVFIKKDVGYIKMGEYSGENVDVNITSEGKITDPKIY